MPIQNILRFYKKNYLFLLSLISTTLLCYPKKEENHPSLFKSWDLERSWFVSPAQARILQKQGAIFLDVRTGIHFSSTPVPSIPAHWQAFSSKESDQKGILLSKDQILAQLKKMSIDTEKVILALGEPIGGWGEEGRIVWMLRSLGITNVYIVDGGIEGMKQILALPESSLPAQIKVPRKNPIPQPPLTIDSETIRENLQNKKYVFLDAREKREFQGKTPYGEKRGGHLPNAKWLYYREFLDKSGFVLEERLIHTKMKELSSSRESVFVTYCTGGVRSAWLTSVLQTYGYMSQNYPGSMWDWTAKEPSHYTLEN